jgi:hypothetical protein
MANVHCHVPTALLRRVASAHATALAPHASEPYQLAAVPAGRAGPATSNLEGVPMDRLEFEAELRRDDFSVVNASLKPNTRAAIRASKSCVCGSSVKPHCRPPCTTSKPSRPFRAGDHCELPAGCLHSTKVGPEGVAYIVGKVDRQASVN